MSTERDRILKMVEDGAINATEAAELLAAVEDEAESPESSDRLPNVAHGDPPWEVPLVAGLVLSAFGLLGLLSGRRAGVLARVGALVTVFAGLAAALVGFWSRNAPWLHINVQERDGNNIRVSLPLLLPLARRLLDLARGFVDADTAVQLDSAAAFIDGLQRGEQQDPLSMEIEDSDGSQVLIYVA